MGLGTIKTIKNMVRDCKVCQKFGKSMVKPKVSLPKDKEAFPSCAGEGANYIFEYLKCKKEEIQSIKR